MPALPVSLIEPIWAQFAVLLPDHPEVSPTHPLGCHRRRVPDRVVFDHVVAALVHGSGYERIASPDCSDRTIRRRMHEWADAGPLLPNCRAAGTVPAFPARIVGATSIRPGRIHAARHNWQRSSADASRCHALPLRRADLGDAPGLDARGLRPA